MARAEAHLDRLGIVTRGAVLASGDPGGFASAYRTLSVMEERGRVQRVYAVEGLGASQFALTGVVDQVRAVERELADGQSDHVLLASADPANPYGAALEWPASDWAGGPGAPHRPSRGAGCHVVLMGGRPVLYHISPYIDIFSMLHRGYDETSQAPSFYSRRSQGLSFFCRNLISFIIFSPFFKIF